MRLARPIVILASALCSLLACRLALVDLGWMSDVRAPGATPIPEVVPAPVEVPIAFEMERIPIEVPPPDLGMRICPFSEGLLYEVPPIPVGYYMAECQQPPGMDVFKWLEVLDLGVYIEGRWDCSEMSAYTEWLLENCGYHTLFVHAPQHVFLLVGIEGEWFAYEPTMNWWVPQWAVSNVEGTRESIVEAAGEMRWMIRDYDFWLARPEVIYMAPNDRLRSE